jgi:hypothetical protein
VNDLTPVCVAERGGFCPSDWAISSVGTGMARAGSTNPERVAYLGSRPVADRDGLLHWGRQSRVLKPVYVLFPVPLDGLDVHHKTGLIREQHLTQRG